MDRNLALEFVRITEAAALSSARFMGRGDEKSADQAAVDAMRKAFDSVHVDGTVVIGEGERDEAPMLFIGERVGKKGSEMQIDIALDPLEGTTICARGGVGSISVIAAAGRGNFLHAPDTYMEKIACGPRARGHISLDKAPEENVRRVAEVLNKLVSDVTVVILDRPRHEALISSVRKTGARIRLIDDGDVSAGIATCWDETGIDLLMGIGGAPEGVITAAALKCMGGDFQGRLNSATMMNVRARKKWAFPTAMEFSNSKIWRRVPSCFAQPASPMDRSFEGSACFQVAAHKPIRSS